MGNEEGVGLVRKNYLKSNDKALRKESKDQEDKQ